MNVQTTAPSTFLADVEGPSDADLAAVEAPESVEDWAALLDAIEPVVTIAKNDEDFWAEDENVHDDRYDGDGFPSWSAFA